MQRIKITINDTRQLKKLLRRNDLFLHVFFFVFSLVFSYVLIKKNPKILDVTITNIKHENNAQITVFEYPINNNTIHKDSLVEKYDNEEEKVLLQIFSEENSIGTKIQIEFDRVTNKAINQVSYYEDITPSSWRDYILNENVLLALFAYAFPLIFILSFSKNRKRKYTILTNGFLVTGSYLSTKTVSDSDSGTSYKHHYQYFVNDKKFKTEANSGNYIPYENVQIIYQIDNPKNAIVFEYQTKRIKNFLRTNNFSINTSNAPIKH